MIYTAVRVEYPTPGGSHSLYRRSIMKRLILAALVVGLVVGADKPKKDDGQKGATALEGTWVVVSVTEDGREKEKGKGAQLVFQGKTVTVKTPEGDHKGTFKIDTKKKTIDLTPDDKGKKVMKGIYQLKGGDLELCFARPDKDRPKDFTAGKASGQGIVLLKLTKSK
jgi:uncharacterized protein (TIGR03067 family)